MILETFGDDLRVHTHIEEGLLKARLAQLIFSYFTNVIFGPKAMIISRIGFDEETGGVQPQFLQSIDAIQFMQCFLGIPIKIPDRMVEVEENVFVFRILDVQFRIYCLAKATQFSGIPQRALCLLCVLVVLYV